MHRVAAESVQRWDDVVLSALASPLRAVLWVFVASMALELVPDLAELREQAAPAYDTVLVMLLTWFVLRLIRGAEAEMLADSRGVTQSVDKASVHATAKLLRVTVWIIAALMVLQTVGVSISGLLAFGGIGGIAVGFAAKDLLANFFGGLSIYLDRPFTTGDWIRSPDQEIEGTVEDIGWRLTRIRTFDQRPLYVPNAVFSQVSVENPSRMRNRRIYETIGLRYDDADKVAAIVAQVREMLEQHEEIDLSRTLIVNFVSFGPSSLDFFVYTFTKTTEWVKFHAIKQDVLLKILAIVHANGADVAFPTTTVHLNPASPEPEA
ncbi:MAG: mechanosensitive ion channel family protein [Proteobacteria bacterium]|nr:mechanosensitive ion channel family protein [Pseudomonadota bacterium]